jgi:hypothetical protein
MITFIRSDIVQIYFSRLAAVASLEFLKKFPFLAILQLIIDFLVLFSQFFMPYIKNASFLFFINTLGKIFHLTLDTRLKSLEACELTAPSESSAVSTVETFTTWSSLFLGESSQKA